MVSFCVPYCTSNCPAFFVDRFLQDINWNGAWVGQFSSWSPGRMLMPFSNIKHWMWETSLINISKFLPEMLIQHIFAITTLLSYSASVCAYSCGDRGQFPVTTVWRWNIKSCPTNGQMLKKVRNKSKNNTMQYGFWSHMSIIQHYGVNTNNWVLLDKNVNH